MDDPVAKGYDPACKDLAEHFLRDEPCAAEPALFRKQAHSLAQQIQDAVEAWFLTED